MNQATELAIEILKKVRILCIRPLSLKGSAELCCKIRIAVQETAHPIFSNRRRGYPCPFPFQVKSHILHHIKTWRKPSVILIMAPFYYRSLFRWCETLLGDM
jgi:hypothetical protein